MKVLQIIGLLLVLVSVSFAQDKIASIDTKVFEDEKLGITELVFAKKKLAEEFNPIIDKLKMESDELKQLSNEIEEIIKSKNNYSTKLLTDKIEKSDKLSRELKNKTDESKAKIEKRELETVEPVKNKITDKIKEFAKQKGYVIVVEQSSINEGVIICGEIADITKEFIKFCNEEFEKEKTQNK